jgi:hypothetical protein
MGKEPVITAANGKFNPMEPQGILISIRKKEKNDSNLKNSQVLKEIFIQYGILAIFNLGIKDEKPMIAIMSTASTVPHEVD